MYAAVLMVFINLRLYFQEGPFNQYVQEYETTCKSRWFTKLLYVDMLFPKRDGVSMAASVAERYNWNWKVTFAQNTILL